MKALLGLMLATILFVPTTLFASAAYAEEPEEQLEATEGADASLDEEVVSSADVDAPESIADESDGMAPGTLYKSEADDKAVSASEPSAEEPPNPTHMWNLENVPQDYTIMLFSSVAPYWATQNGQKAFCDGYGSLYASPALRVIDVSEWQGSNINWDAVAGDGVDAAILRIGWGDGAEDKYFARNLSEVRRIGMPYGVYLYSYAYDADFARGEANSTADLLDKYNCKDLSLPIYYDIERFDTWSGHSAPSDPGTYEQIIRAYIDTMASRGYTNVHVYTYRSYLQNELNSTYIRQRTSWIAEYGARLNITNSDYSGQYGWQYTSTDDVSGIEGPVDMSAFSGLFSDSSLDVARLPLAPQITNGTYYIDSLLKPSSSIDITWGSTESGARTQLYSYNKSSAQQFEFVGQGDGSYVIRNVNSGLVLDVQNAVAGNGAVVQQYATNGSDAQRWLIRDSGSGYYIQSALGNWVLDINGASTADGAAITLYTPNGSDAQKFMLASANTGLVPTGDTVKIASAANPSLVFDIENGAIGNLARLQIYAENGSDAQSFSFDEVGNGLYTITSSVSGRLIEVSSGLTGDGSAVAQYDANGTISQSWVIRDYGSGAFALLNAKSGKAIDVPSANMQSGNKLQIYTPNGSSAQLWRTEDTTISRERLDALAGQSRGILVDGESYVIQSTKDTSQVLDVQWGSLASGANVWLYGANSTSAQRWTASIDDVGYVTLTNELTGKALDVANACIANYANVQQWEPNGTWSQKWIPVKNGDGSITLLSALAEGYALDLDSGATSDMTNVQLYQTNNSDAQKFNFDPAPPIVEDGVYTIESALNRRVTLDVQWGSAEDGANVWLYEDNGSDAQRWHVSQEDGTLKIINVASGKSLDLMWGGTTSGTNVWQYADNGTQAQRWRAIKNSDGSITLRSVLAPSLVLDVSGGVAANESNVQVYEQNSTAAQSFFFERVE